MSFSLLRINKALYSNKLTTTSYPYAFGGINIQFKQNQGARTVIRQLFGQDTFEGFKQAYRFILKSLENKDRSNLQNILQGNLIKNINFKNVKLVNQNSNIEIVCGSMFKAMGTGFNRSQSINELKQMDNTQNNKAYLNVGIINPSMNSQIMKYINSGLPVLLGYQILFLSDIKLLNDGQGNLKTKQVHSIQFQVQGSINLMKHMKSTMSFASIGPSSLNMSQAKKILKQMIGNDYSWKIGDIDRILKGNIKVI